KSLEPFGYILKPFDERNLHAAIEVALFRSQMERKLKQREEWLAAILQAMADAVIAIDAKSDIVFMNEVAQALTGYRSEEATGKNLGEFGKLIDQETRQAVERAA